MPNIEILNASYTIPVTCQIVKIKKEDLMFSTLELFLEKFGFKASLLFPVHHDYFKMDMDQVLGITFYPRGEDSIDSLEGRIGDFLIIHGFKNIGVFTPEMMEQMQVTVSAVE